MAKDGGPAPDYKGAAEQTAQANQNNVATQTTANRPDQVTPWASAKWYQGPDGHYYQSVGFNGQLGSAATGLQNQAAFSFGQPLDTGTAARQQAIDSAYQQATSRLDPQWNLREDRSRTQLLNQGLDPSSEAYQNQMSDLGRQRNDAYTSAMNSAVGQGTEAGTALFNQNMAARNMPLQELQALQGFLAMPGFNGAGVAPGANYLQASQDSGDYQLKQADMQNQFWGDAAHGALDAGGKVAGAILSDERAKKNIHRMPVEAVPGVPVATFQYKKDPNGTQHVGVIAQDLEKVAPQMVREGPDGMKRVHPAFAPFAFR